ncbi:hypothetical protein [Pseudomonas sp. 10S4]|uniref:hypothetical protein n=1 Tax=Pseudomonas sp. 10S4 TaxID=3048583 RepID=UPI002AC90C6F|nr:MULTISPECIES: hypothetical protein [unclassified Pseudomonas]MEB0226289.1 hypothetical protein [Pseudomonas sp. 5S1]MEB0294890.1 hypothetical protein [Pseudomonas sp. 10S4]WPX18163.1 hypothetical protein RHM58_31200 [Pseudomonas sp. 10S4]
MSALRKPIPEDDFLETQAGQDWLAESVNDLLSRRDVEAPNPVGRSVVLVNADQLPEALADHMAAQRDPDHCIEKILIELVKRADDSLLHRWAVRAVGGDPLTVRSMAVGLIAEHANEYRDAKRESDRLEQECGF